jgi:hypothetical protein
MQLLPRAHMNARLLIPLKAPYDHLSFDLEKVDECYSSLVMIFLSWMLIQSKHSLTMPRAAVWCCHTRPTFEQLLV